MELFNLSLYQHVAADTKEALRFLIGYGCKPLGEPRGHYHRVLNPVRLQRFETFRGQLAVNDVSEGGALTDDCVDCSQS